MSSASEWLGPLEGDAIQDHGGALPQPLAEQAGNTTGSYYPDFHQPQSLTGPLEGDAIQDHGGALPQPLAGQLDSIETYIGLHHVGKWHMSLNCHASSRPKEYGGPLVRAVTACKTFTQAAPGSASAPWHCSLDLPNSFSPEDGLLLHAEGEGPTKDDASEHACRNALAQLLMGNPSQVVLRPSQWKVTPEDLLANLPGIDHAHQALPVHVRSRSQASGAEGATLSPTTRDARVTAILRKCLHMHSGRFDPSRIGRAFYTELDGLLLPGALKPFVEGHPEFAWTPTPDGNKWSIIWAPSATSAPSAASAPALTQEENPWADLE